MFDAEANGAAPLRASSSFRGQRPVLCPPEAKYFQVGPMAADQFQDYAARKDFDLATTERWLAPGHGHSPKHSQAKGMLEWH